MTGFSRCDDQSKLEHLAGAPLLFGAVSGGILLALYMYLGLFTRHMADDFCIARFDITQNFPGALWNRYLTVSNRYSNITLMSLNEALGPTAIRYLPASMILLWVAGTFWFLRELRLLLRLNQHPLVDANLSIGLAFFSILQAPNLFQTIYWRSGMVTHFVPLVGIAFLLALTMQFSHRACAGESRTWMGPTLMVFSFVVGGFSEPPTAVMIVGLVLLLGYLFVRRADRLSRPAIPMISWTLGGMSLAMLVLILAPGNSLRLGSEPPDFPTLIVRSFKHALEYILGVLRGFPIPSLVTFVWSGAGAYVFFGRRDKLTRRNARIVLAALAASLLFTILFVAVSFAPSVYGQSFPVERARFMGRGLLTVGIIAAGILSGILVAQAGTPRLRSASSVLALTIMLVCALYPLRFIPAVTAEVAVYRDRAQAWDARDALIRELKANGETDLVIPQLSGFQGVKEWELYPEHWVNRCAAQYYAVNTISTYLE